MTLLPEGEVLRVELGPDDWRPLFDIGWGAAFRIASVPAGSPSIVLGQLNETDSSDNPLLAEGCDDVDIPSVIVRGGADGSVLRTAWDVSEQPVTLAVTVDSRLASVEVELTVVDSNVPTINDAVVLVDSRGFGVEVSGVDLEGDVASAELWALDAGGAPLAFDLRRPSSERLLLGAITNESQFTASGFYPFEGVNPAIASAWVTVEDVVGNRSNRFRAPVRNVERVGLGLPCDDEGAACVRELRCVTGECAVNTALDDVCARAELLDLGTEVPTTFMVSHTESRVPLGIDCEEPRWARAMRRLRIPPGTFDLFIESTVETTPGGFDMSLRSRCSDPTSQVSCGDGFTRIEALGVTDSEVTLLTSVPDDALSDPVEIIASLRPVLSSGADCDPDEVNNRCELSPCDMTSRRCP